MSDAVIIGAGPGGLGAAIALGERASVLERDASPGGLCQTVELAGALFDLGGHSFHTPHKAIRDLVFAATPMEEQRREAWCFATVVKGAPAGGGLNGRESVVDFGVNSGAEL